jgi:LysR family transcriptional regulator, glycine cleavage system transcriptional activator
VSPNLSYIPPITTLRAFERAAARLSFRLAAHELSLTPSAVSHQIRGLEQHFGTRLFLRTGRTLSLTSVGQSYLASIRPSLLALEKSSQLLSPREGGRRELVISALPYVVSVMLLPRLNEFAVVHPGVTFRFDTKSSYADFDTSTVDLAIRMGRERSAGLHLDKLLDVRALPVCAPQLLKGKNAIRVPADLCKHTLIGVSLQPSRWAHWLQAMGVPDLVPKGEIWFDSVPLALEAVELGLGVALAMDPLVRSTPSFGRVLVAPLAVSGDKPLTYYAVTRPEQKDDPLLLAFRRWLMQISRDLRGLMS